MVLACYSQRVRVAGQRMEVTVYGVINHNYPRPPESLVKQFAGIWTSTLADTMGRHGVMMPEIRPIFENIKVLGVAFTVLNYPSDNITTHKAITMLKPGDVLVVDEGRENNTGSFGHNMSLQARNRGIVGLVTNGCVRDIKLLRSGHAEAPRASSTG